MDAVRQLSPEEIPTALADLQLIAEAGHAPDFNFFGPELIFVYTINEGIVAFGCLAFYDGVWTLRNCVVHPAYRGRGIQVELIKERVGYAPTWSPGSSYLGGTSQRQVPQSPC